MLSSPEFRPPHIAALPSRRAQIDGLRTIAMAGVLYVHYLDKKPTTEHLRVSLFFVVSGFLISHMLCGARARGGLLLPVNFYIRRALRLMPPLLVLVAFGYATNADDFRQYGFWHLFQMSNISFALQEGYKPWIAAHLWSLNSLEQFYLLCPLIIFYLRLPAIYIAMGTVWAALVFVRTNADAFGLNGWWLEMVINQDPILFGVIAYLLCLNEAVSRVVRSLPCIALAIATLASPLAMPAGYGLSESYRLFCEPALAIIVAGAFFGYAGPIGAMMESRVAGFLSKISYGVYMYHMPVWWVIGTLYPAAWTPTLPIAALLVAATVLTATLSWHLIENPLANLKSYFPTRRAPRPSEADAQLT